MRRLRKILKDDGRAVIVAMDHGIGLKVNPALDEAGEVIKKIVAGGADAILANPGLIRRYEEELKDVAVILRVDGGSTSLGTGSDCPEQIATIEEALRLGVDAIACMGFPGASYEARNISRLTQLCEEAHKWNIPVVAEMLPGGFDPSVPDTVENLKATTRIGCECGADLIKTKFAGTVEEYKSVISASFAPVVVLGGEKVKDLGSLYQCIEQAIEAGASGVAIGRNVWKAEDPEAITRNLVDLVHNNRKACEL